MASGSLWFVCGNIGGVLGTFAGGDTECISNFYKACEVGAVHSVYYFGNCHWKGNWVIDLFLFRVVVVLQGDEGLSVI